MRHCWAPTQFMGLRACAFGKVLEMRWPEHPSFPSHGYVITRKDLDQIVAERAAKAGAQVLQGCEALEPLLPLGALPHSPLGALPHPLSHPPLGAVPHSPVGRGASRDRRRGAPASLPALAGAVVADTGSGTTREIRARYVVVADGSNSRFGRALGTSP